MRKSFSTIGFCYLSCAAIAGQPHLETSAISPEAKAIQEAKKQILLNVESSQGLFGDKLEALEELKFLAYECSEEGWDGNGASPINDAAFQAAKQFIRALPAGFPMPEFSCEPDGMISLDWLSGKNRILSLSVGNQNRIAFAWLDGVDKGHAVAGFNGLEISKRILDEITRITTNATVRPS
jgi:hypothetical protein